VIVLDTHAWLWWLAEPSKLSRAARQAIDEADAIGVCAISAWELGMLVRRGRISLDRDVGAWIRQALAPRRVAPAPGLLAAVRAALPDAPVLPIGTSGTVGGTHGHDVEAMEGFAVLRACELAGVPAIEVRAVSNEIEEADRALWRFDDALAALAAALPRLVTAIESASAG